MRIHPLKMKIILLLCWLVQTHDDLMEQVKQAGGEVREEVQGYQNLLDISKKIIGDYDFKKSPNYKAISQKLKICLDLLISKLPEGRIFPLVLILQVVRKAPLDKVSGLGFDKLKQINFDELIAIARQENFLNPLAVQRLSEIFAKHYW